MIAPLWHLAMVTYAVPPERVRPHVPPQFELDTRTDQQGKEHAFVSVVTFKNERMSMSLLPWLRLTFLQVNYRTYVRYQGNPGAWFFTVVLQSPLAHFQRQVFGAPAFTAPMRLTYDWDADRQHYRRYRFDSAAPRHTLHLEIEGVDKPAIADTMFASPDEMAHFLTWRLVGYYRERKTHWGRSMTVWHEPMQPRCGVVRTATSTILDRLELVPTSEQSSPYAILLQPRIDFFGQLPKRLLLTQGAI